MNNYFVLAARGFDLAHFAACLRANIASEGNHQIDDIMLRDLFRAALPAQSDFDRSVEAFCEENGFKHELRNHEMSHVFSMPALCQAKTLPR